MKNKRSIFINIAGICLAACLITACGVGQEAEITAGETTVIAETEINTDVAMESDGFTESESEDYSYTFRLVSAPEGFSDDITLKLSRIKDRGDTGANTIEVILTRENDYQDEIVLNDGSFRVENTSFSSGYDYSFESSYHQDDHFYTMDLYVADEPTWNTGCSYEQEEIIKEAVQGMLYHILDYKEEQTSIESADVTDDFMVEYLYEILKHAGEDSYIVSYLGMDSDSRLIYDKASALKNIGDIWGKTLSEEALDSYNERYSKEYGKDLIIINDDTLSISMDNENDTDITCLDFSYGFNLATIGFYFDYKVNTDLQGENPYKKVSSSFAPDKNSFLGYSCLGFNIRDAGYDEYSIPERTGELITCEGYLFYESGDISVPNRFKEYELDVLDSDGNCIENYSLKDASGEICNARDQYEWEEYIIVRVTGELDSDGYLWVYEITPLVVWDPNTGENAYLEQ